MSTTYAGTVDMGDPLSIAVGLGAGFGALEAGLHELVTGYKPGEGAQIVNDFQAAVNAKLAQAAEYERQQAEAAKKKASTWTSANAAVKMQYGGIKSPAPSLEPDTRASVPMADQVKAIPTWAKVGGGVVLGTAVLAVGYKLLGKKRRK